jgi:molecular chaperone GrpE (heat shock protein)
MLDFETELNKLLSREREMLPRYEFAELAAAGQKLLVELDRKQTDVSLQIEEIYDLSKERRDLDESLKSAKAAKNQLVAAAVGIADLIEYFHAYARRSGSEDLKNQAGVMWQNAVLLLSGCGIFRFGEAGEPLDPQIHTVKASAQSSFPRESVAEVLQSGYVSQNSVLRKAAVVVSLGPEDTVAYGDGGGERRDDGQTENQNENRNEIR